METTSRMWHLPDMTKAASLGLTALAQCVFGRKDSPVPQRNFTHCGWLRRHNALHAFFVALAATHFAYGDSTGVSASRLSPLDFLFGRLACNDL